MANAGMSATTDEGYYHENGRAYGTFRRGQYLLPCDATERDRLDVMNTLFKTVRERDKRLLSAPFREREPGRMGSGSRVLDLGCGTGIWLLEMAEQYSRTEFVGIDLNAMGPQTLLANVELRDQCDYESPWSLGEHSWDLIHLQLALGSVTNWPELYRKIVRHLKPGTGYFESVEIDLMPRCDDRTMQPGRLSEWFDYIKQAFASTRRSIEYDPETEEHLARVGFKDIQHKVYRLPLNGWPLDRTAHRAGVWYNISLSPGHERTGGFGMEAISLAALTRFFRWPADHVRRLCDEALQQASDPNVHAYNLLHVYHARAPYNDER